MKKIFLAIIILTMVCLLSVPAFATQYTWNGNGGNTNMDTGNNWVGGAAPSTPSDTVVFATPTVLTNNIATPSTVNFEQNANITFNSTTDFTVAASGSHTFGIGNPSGSTPSDDGITAQNPDTTLDTSIRIYTIAAPVLLYDSQTWTVSNNGTGGINTTNLAVSGAIGDGGNAYSLTKAGTGTLTLTGANTYTGGTIISGGTLQISAANNLSNNTITISGGSTLESTSSFTLASNQAITLGAGGGTIQEDNGDTLTVSGAVTNGGNLLTVTGAGSTTINGGISGTGGLTMTTTAAGTLYLSGTGLNTYSGTTTITTGRLIALAANALSPNSAVNLANAATAQLLVNNHNNTIGALTGGGSSGGNVSLGYATLTTGGNNDVTDSYAGVISGAGGVLIKTGSGTQILSGTNTYTGGTTISNGALDIASTSALPGWNTNGSYSVASGATLAVYNAVTDANIATMLGTTNFASGSALGFDTTTANRTYSANLVNTAQGALGLEKLGTNTLTLTGANTYTGATTVSVGKLLLDHGSSSSADYFVGSGISIAGGATFEINQSSAAARYSSISRTISGAGTFSKTGAGTTWVANDALGTITTFDQSAGGLINVQGGVLYSIKTASSNLGSLTIASGATATLDVKTSLGADAYFDALNGGGSLAYDNSPNLASTITLGVNGGSGTFSGVISNGSNNGSPVSVTKTGSGTQIFSGAEAYTGATTISNGTLQIGDGGTTGALSTSSSITDNGTLSFNRRDTVTQGADFANAISGSGGVTQAGSGTLVLNAANTYTGTTTVNGGTLYTDAINSSFGAIGHSNVIVNNGGTIDVSATAGTGYDNSFVGYDASAKTITINAGGLIIDTAGHANELHALIMNGGTLQETGGPNTVYGNWDFKYTTSTLGNGSTSYITGGNAMLTQSGGAVFNVGAGDVLNVSTALEHLAEMPDTGLIKQGNGTLVLSGANTFTSGTNINGGVLQLTGAGTLGLTLAANTITFNGGTLEITSGINSAFTTAQNITVGSSGGTIQSDAITGTTLTDSGAVSIANNATLTVTGSGNTTLSGNIIGNTGGIGAGVNAFLDMAGTGTLILSGTNSFNNISFNVTAGTLQLGSSSALGYVRYPSSVNSGGTLDLNGSTIPSSSFSELGIGGTGVGGNGALINSSASNAAWDANSLYLVANARINCNGTGTLTINTTNSPELNNPYLALGTYGLTVGGVGNTFIYNIITSTNSNGTLTKDGTGTLQLLGANTYSGTTTVSAGKLQAGVVNTFSPNSAVSLANVAGAILDLNNFSNIIGALTGGGTTGGNVSLNSGTLTTGGNSDTSDSYGGVISGSGGLTKVGTGTQTLLDINTYSGTTTVSAGTLALSNAATNNIAYSTMIDVASGAFLNTSGLSGGGITLASGQTLEGSGTVTGGLTVGTGSTLSPGNSPGTINDVGNVTYAPSGTYTWQLNKALGTAGTDPGWDLQSITGNLAVTATSASGSKFSIDITGLTLANAPGVVADFNKYSNYSWNIANFATSSGFSASDFSLLTDKFTNFNNINGTSSSGSFSIIDSGTSLLLDYTAPVNTPPDPIDWNGTTNTVWNYHTGGGTTNWVNGSGVEANAIPTSTSDVYFYYTGAGNLATTLGQNFTINSLTMNGASPVTISGNTLTINSSNGIIVDSGAGALTINSNVILGGAQTWLNNSSNVLSVAGNVNNGAANLTIDGTGATNISGIISNGILTKNGTGILDLSGVNTYAGGTTLNNGTLEIGVASSGSVGAITSSAIGQSTLVLNGGEISSDSVTARTLYNAVTFGGNVILGDATHTGVLDFEGAGTLTGTQALTTNSNIIYNGAIGDGGNNYGITKNGTGTLTLGGLNTYTGLTTVSAGTLQAGSPTYTTFGAFGDSSAVTVAGGATLDGNGYFHNIGSLSGSGTVTDSAADTLSSFVVGQDNSSTTFSGIIEDGNGQIGLTKKGSGTFTLSGDNTYSGGTTINSGTLQVSNPYALGTGSVVNNSILDIGATNLTGIGAYTTQTSSPSTLNLAANSSSTYGNITTTSATSSSSVTANSTVNVTVTGYIPNNAILTIINTNGNGITGVAPTTVNALDSSRVHLISSISGNNLILTADHSSSGFASLASNSNASAAGTVLDNVTNPTSAMITVLNTLEFASNSQITSSLNTMTPIVDAGIRDSSYAALNNFVGASLERAQGVLTLAAATPGKSTTGAPAKPATTGSSSGDESKLNGIWAKAYGSYLDQGTRNGIQGYNAWNSGTAVGYDHLFGDSLTVGVSGGYAYGHVNSDANNASTNVTSGQGTVYAGYQDTDIPYFIDIAGSFADNWYKGQRDINLVGTTTTAYAKYDGKQYGTYLDGGYKINLGKTIELTPLASLQWDHLGLSSYTESNAGALGLSVNRQSYDILESGLGARVSAKIEYGWGNLTPEVHVKWLYDFINDAMSVTSTFTGGGASFITNGAKTSKNGANLGGKLSFDLKNDVSIIAECDTVAKDHFFGVYGSAAVRYKF